VRAPKSAGWKRGERALIISFDTDREAYEIARLEDGTGIKG